MTCETGDGSKPEVRGSRFSELRTQNFEHRIAPVALFPPVSPVALSQGLEMAAEAFMDLAGLNALTAYQRCVIPTALAHRLGA